MNAQNVREEIDRTLGTVDEVMQRTVVSLSPKEAIADAAMELARRGVSGAPVVERGRVVGMVSLRDLFEAAGIPPERAATSGPWHRYEHLLRETPMTVGDVMVKTVVTIPPGTPIPAAAALMREWKVNRIPVVEPSGAVVGIVARDDVIEAVARIVGRRMHSVRPNGLLAEPGVLV
jgi:CBS domain-containing protein